MAVFNVNAATYTFVQSSWSGGADASAKASHASNRTNWTKYESASGVVANSTISLSSTSASAVDQGLNLVALSPATVAAGSSPRASVVSPDGTSFYVINNGGPSVSMYSRNATTGALTALATPTISTGSNPQDIAMSPDGTSVYVASYGTQTISMYSRNTTTGALTALATPTVAAGTPMSLAVSPDGAFVYATNYSGNTVSVYSRNVTTGALTSSANVAAGSGPNYVTISPDGSSAYVTSSGANTVSMYSRNTSTGALTPLSPATIAPGMTPSGITISPDGSWAYILSSGSSRIAIYSRNTTTGVLTSSETIYLTVSPYDLSLSSNGRAVYLSTNGGTFLYGRNTTTGALTLIGSISSNASYGVSASPDGAHVYFTYNNNATVAMFRVAYSGGAQGFESGSHSSTSLVGSGATTTVRIREKGLLLPLSPATLSIGSASYGVTVSPDGNSVYVASRDSNKMYMYSRNTTTGALTALVTPDIVVYSPYRIAISPDGTSVYVTDSGGVSMFSRNTTTGALTALATPTIAAGGGPRSIVISSDSLSVYVANYTGSTISMYSRNTTTGALTALATPTIAAGTNPYGIVISPDGTSVYAVNNNSSNVSMYSRNTTTGALTALATPTIAAGGGPRSIVISSDGLSVYVANYTGSTISMYSRNTTTGALTALATPTVGVGSTSAQDMYISSDGTSVYTANQSGSVSQLSRNTSTGYLTLLTPATLTPGGNVNAISGSPDGTSVYVASYGNNILTMYSRFTGSTSGSFTSGVIDTGTTAAFTTVVYTATTTAGQGVTIDVRTGNVATPDGSWSAWVTGLSSGSSISTLSGRYAQYRLNLTSSSVDNSPTVGSVTLDYAAYSSSGSLTSSPFDTSSSGNLLSSIAWSATTPSGTTVKFQVRSAPDAAGSPGTWSGWMGPDGTANTYFTASDGSQSFPASLRDGSDEQWFQYKAFLSQTSGLTPTLSDVTVTYVVNAPPEFDESFGTGGIQAYQVASSSNPNIGKIYLGYKIRDPDTTTGSNTAGYVTPSFEYNIGSGWVSVPTQNMTTGSTDNKGVSEGSFTLYETYIDSASLFPNTYNASARIRVTINDNEGANNIAQAISSSFVLDTKAPTIESMHIDGTSATNTVSFAGSDDTTIREYILSNNSNFTPDTQNSSSGIAQSVGSSSLAINTAWVFAPGSPKTVYLKLVDSRGNVTTRSVAIPGTPSNIEYRDISSIDTGSYRVFVAWNLYPDPAPEGASFGSYELYSSDDGTNYSLLYTTANPAINYYIHTPVSTSTVYYYKVAFTTSNGDRSSFSPTISDIPDGKGGTNNGAIPLISNVSATDLKNTSAKVTWTTDDLALSEVDFGTTNSYGRVASNRSYVTDHGVYLTGLTPNTTYYYRVRSIDAFSGSATDDNGGQGYTFTTGGGPVISNVTTSSISDTSAEIVWRTNIAADSHVSYSTSPSLLTSTEAGSDTLVESPFQHTVTLSGLTTDTVYYYKVTSTDAENNTTVDDNQGSYYTFRTTSDEKDPIISDVSVPVKASDGAVITWRTDELSTSQVEYGTVSGSSTSYLYTTTEITTPSIFHAVTLSSETNRVGGGTNTLVKKTQYFFRVKSTDRAGNSTYSEEGTFATTEDGAVNILGGGYSSNASDSKNDTTPPTISNIKVTDITPFGATVTFDTNETTRSVLQYGETINYSKSAADLSFVTSHSIPLKGLRMGTEYNLLVSAVDKAGNVAKSTNQTFKTEYLAQDLGSLLNIDDVVDEISQKLDDLIQSALPSINPPFIEEPKVEDVGEDFARITWRTNVKAYGIVSHAEDKTYFKDGIYTGEESKVDNKTTEHSVTLSNLKPNTKYHFKVKSYVFPGALGESPDMTFVTKAGRIQIQVRDRRKDSMRVIWDTPVPTTSVVTYKVLGSQYAAKKIDDGLTTVHDVLLDNLNPKTTYEIRAYGVTAQGNMIETRDGVVASTNEDTTPPAISNFKVDSALVPGRTDRTQTIVSWKTDEPATSVVYYDEGSGSATAKLSQVKDSGMVYTDNHVVILTNLKPGTIYRFQIVSTDDANNQTKLPVRTIVTPSQSESVVDIIFKNFDETFKFMRTVR